MFEKGKRQNEKDTILHNGTSTVSSGSSPGIFLRNGSNHNQQTEDQTKPDANQESAADEDGDIFSALRGKDFGWTKITILCRDNEGSSYKNEFGITEETGDIVEDAIYKRNLTVSNLLNVDIETITMDGSWNNQDEFMGLIRNSVAAGDHEYDIITGYQAYITQLAMGGEVISMLGLPYVDYTQPWWNGETIEQNTVNGKVFLRERRYRIVDILCNECCLFQ